MSRCNKWNNVAMWTGCLFKESWVDQSWSLGHQVSADDSQALTVMAFRLQLAFISWLCCVGWQLVYWHRIIWLPVPPSSPSSVPTVSELSACQRRRVEQTRILSYRLTEAEKLSAHSLFLCLVSGCTFWRAFLCDSIICYTVSQEDLSPIRRCEDWFSLNTATAGLQYVYVRKHWR